MHDDVNKYQPQPTSRGFFVRNVIMDEIALIIPNTYINVMSPILNLMIDGCRDIGKFGFI
jgi:hypothetical protein